MAVWKSVKKVNLLPFLDMEIDKGNDKLIAKFWGHHNKSRQMVVPSEGTGVFIAVCNIVSLKLWDFYKSKRTVSKMLLQR